MPCSYQILQEFPLILRKYYGEVAAHEPFDNFRACMNDPAYTPGMTEFVDCSAVIRSEIDHRGMQALAREMKEAYAAQGVVTRIAYFAPSDYTFGMSRMFQTLIRDDDCMIVSVHRTKEGALQALSMPLEIAV